MAQDKLATYRGKRTAGRTPEPVPPEPEGASLPHGADDTFVIQEHHARALHWDFRLERGGVLVSWAIPKGLPADPARNHLAVQTEDHPLDYAGFAGEIPQGEYGGGRVSIWDRGRYECQKWSDREVMVVLHGERASGRYVLFRTRGKNWMIHRMDPPPAGTAPMPDGLRPMLATPGRLPAKARQGEYGYEAAWDGRRALVYVEGGRVRVTDASGADITAKHPELRPLGAGLGTTRAVLDGEIITHPGSRAAVYVVTDLLYLDGTDTTGLAYRQRRELLESLDLRGPAWDAPDRLAGEGRAALDAARALGLGGVVAKRLDSPYLPGQRSRSWIAVGVGPASNPR